jgi:hypothetical protein
MKTRARCAVAGAALAIASIAAGGVARADEPAAPGGERPAEEVRDGPRLRGGFSLNGGVFLLPNNPTGGAFSLAGRVGVQLNRYLSVYYQNTPIVGATVSREMRSGTVVFSDYNSLLLNLTLLHLVELGVGPSLDYVALARGSLMVNGLDSSASASSGTGIAGGAHGRFAVNIGSFSLGVDAHPLFLSTGKALSLTTGLGAEWF